MDSEKTGGQAFPHGDPTNGGDIGMTLLDHFAGLAMQAAWTGDTDTYPGPSLTDKVEHEKAIEAWREANHASVAKWAYRQALVMIAERNRLLNDKP